MNIFFARGEFLLKSVHPSINSTDIYPISFQIDRFCWYNILLVSKNYIQECMMAESDPNKLFLGKLYTSNNILTDEKMFYDPSDLNTHCIITGMTGSGKTGLGILMLEEIALKGIPAIIIDPKGDLTNLLLHFPNMTGKDIAPWLDPEAPVREGKELYEYANEKAEAWKEGQQGWGYQPEDIAKLSDVDYTVFTPGSTIGNPINIMATFSAPESTSIYDEEAIREEIATSVTALLGLIGYSNIDPLKSKEHILLSNIIESFWTLGKDVTLVDLINAVNDPPFDTLGALSIDKIYPPKERFSLALQINNFLASPTFKAWNEGPGLDIASLIRNKDNKPRFNIFYLQHLSDQEKMFFVTMLYSQIEAWMRNQNGTGNLRLAVYFDEMAGYVPPTANPSSKPVIMRMMKQARAYGVGLILATQNPVDIDYKGLSNAGTWFVGRLQTEQDKNRLLDGLTTTDGNINRSDADKLISDLKKRAFLYMNVHEKGLKVLTTRWTMNYLAGPLTKNLIPKLYQEELCVPYTEEDAKAAKLYAAHKNRESDDESEDGFLPENADEIHDSSKESENMEENKEGQRPTIAATINEYFMPATKSPAECESDGAVTYIPVWIAQAEVRAEKAKYSFSLKSVKAAKIEDEDLRGSSVRWDDYLCDPFDLNDLMARPEFADAYFQTPPAWMTDAKTAKTYESDFVNYIYRDASITVWANEKIGVYADEDDTEDEFLDKCREKIESLSSAEIEKVKKTHEAQLDKLEAKLKKLNVTLEDKQSQVKQRGVQTIAAAGELILSLIQKRKKSVSSSLTKVNQTSTAKKAQEKVELDIEAVTDQIQAAIDSYEEKLDEIKAKWDAILDQNKEVRITVAKKDIFVDAFGICWTPYYTNSYGKLVKAF